MTDRNHCERMLVSIPEAVGITGLGRTTIYELLDQNAFTAVKIGRRRMIVLDSLREWVASLTEQA
ncbi:MAG: helix-turn-helix domain-containing protein [Rhodospirillales bacterium]|nr:helix-turn-helix domain-containing protein [Rhodospirillales bacterium]